MWKCQHVISFYDQCIYRRSCWIDHLPRSSKEIIQTYIILLACILPFIGLALLLVVGFVCPQNIVLTAVAGVIVKTGTGLELGCATVFLSDVVDYGEYKLGTRNESVVFSLQTLIVKFTAALTSLSLDLHWNVQDIFQIQTLYSQH